MSLFNITWRTQVTNLLPSFKRSTSLIDFITSLLDPLTTKAAEWLTFDNDIKKRARFNAQILVLQSALNNIFGVTSSPFILVETQTALGNSVYIYNEAEGFNPTYIYNASEGTTTYIFNAAELGDGYNFVIKIPVGIYTAELDRRIKAEVNTYKLAGMKFNTETY